MYPNADRDSLAAYFIASQQLQRDTTELVAELREVVCLLLAIIDESETSSITVELYDRVQALLEDD